MRTGRPATDSRCAAHSLIFAIPLAVFPRPLLSLIGGTETADFPEHVGHVDRAHVVHELAVENFGVERGLVEGGIGAGDGIRVGGVVGIGGISLHFKDVQQNGLFVLLLLFFGGRDFGGGRCRGSGRRDGRRRLREQGQI